MFLISSFLGAGLYYPPKTVLAVDTSLTEYFNGQHYNNIVLDSDFLNINSMSVADIQSFLSAKGGFLATATPDQLGPGAEGRSAAQIIYDAAHGLYDAAVGCSGGACVNSTTGTISPQAIMITLQKEQSLITTQTFSQTRLNSAMGYGCPDANTYGCPDSRHPEWLGFTNQVGWAAWQLRNNIMRYDLGKNDICGNHPGTWISIADRDGIRPVYLTDRATTSLYCYTPHTFYGNYNFWRLGIEWFGYGTSSGDVIIAGANDTSSISARFYSNHGNYLIKSMKKSNETVSFVGGLIAAAGSTSWEYSLDPAIGTHDYVFQYSSGVTKTVTIEKRKNGDINGDGVVNLLDLSLIGNAWGQTVKDDNWTNLNPDVDNEINLLDISIFANNWEG